MKLFLLMLKNLRRNLIRSTLTAAGTMVLVLVVIGVWSVLDTLGQATAEKSGRTKIIVTERWQIPSQMPPSYVGRLLEGAYDPRDPKSINPSDSCTWSFFVGSLKKDMKGGFDRESFMFAIGTQADKVMTMFDELDEIPPGEGKELREACARMGQIKQGMIAGQDVLSRINKRVGDRITVYGTNYRGIDLEFEIVGTFPPGRYDGNAVYNAQYLFDALDAYPTYSGGKKHDLADRCVNLVWLRVNSTQEFNQITEQVESSPYFSQPPVKCETQSSGVAAFLDAYRDLFWGIRWLLSPAILITLSLIISNAISISVRERRTELAVLKVLGFRPAQIVILVLGEAVLLGTVASVVCTSLLYVWVNHVVGGFKFPIAFFGVFFVPKVAFIWGLAVGSLTALVGSAIPALNACRVKVSEVFAKVT